MNSDDEKDNGDNNDADEAAEPNKKKKRKKKQGKEGLKEKKEQKRFALEGQFKGMEMPSFAGVSLSDNMNFENTKADPEEADHSKNDTPAKLSKKMKRKSEGGAILGENGNETKKKKKGRRSLD